MRSARPPMSAPKRALGTQLQAATTATRKAEPVSAQV